MAARGRRVRRTKRPAAVQRQRVPTKYEQFLNLVDLNGLASGADIGLDILNNSSQLGSNVVKVMKATIQTWFRFNMDDLREILVAVVRHDEADESFALDDRATVRDLRNEGKLLRGPWCLQTVSQATSSVPVVSPWGRFMKTIVLKNLVLDEDDDVSLMITNVDSNFAASNQEMRNFVKVFYRVVS